MLPSEILRQEISKKYNIDLEQYSWPENFKQQVFSIKLDKDLESNANTLEEIYLHGFNIGHCGLTSRYIARQFNTATLFYGKAKLLVGTKGSRNGEHAWTILNNYLVDTTLMICIPISLIEKLGYSAEKELAYDSARTLSEFDIYDIEFDSIYNKTNNKK